jgi:hypothetical protein
VFDALDVYGERVQEPYHKGLEGVLMTDRQNYGPDSQCALRLCIHKGPNKKMEQALKNSESGLILLVLTETREHARPP